MSDIEVDMEVAAPREHVWEVLTDFDRIGEWISAHEGFPEPPPDLAPGVQFRQRLGTGDLNGEVEWTVDAVEPPSYVEWHGTGPAGAAARVSYRLHDTDTGTRVEHRTELDFPGGPLGGVAATAAKPQGRAEMESSLERLRDLVEAGLA